MIKQRFCLLIGASVLGLVGMRASYGSMMVSTNNVDFSQIQQSATGTAPVPTTPYGNYSVTGDTLVFAPTAFHASTTGGGIDFIDGTLTMLVKAHAGHTINQLKVYESGDYTLLAPNPQDGTAQTQVSVAAPLTIQILSVDGHGIAPIIVQQQSTFTPGGQLTLTDHPGQGQFWSGGTTVDLVQALRSHGIEHGLPTQLMFSLDNSLFASSEADTSATISKKAFDVTPLAASPEPSSLALAGLGAVLLLKRRRQAAFS